MEKQIDLSEIKEQFFSIEQNMCDGYQHEHTINVAKLMKSKSKFAKGTTHNVYVMKKQDQVKSALFIFA